MSTSWPSRRKDRFDAALCTLLCGIETFSAFSCSLGWDIIQCRLWWMARWTGTGGAMKVIAYRRIFLSFAVSKQHLKSYLFNAIWDETLRDSCFYGRRINSFYVCMYVMWMMSALLLSSVGLRKLWNPLQNYLLDRNACKFFSFFSPFIFYNYAFVHVYTVSLEWTAFLVITRSNINKFDNFFRHYKQN